MFINPYYYLTDLPVKLRLYTYKCVKMKNQNCIDILKIGYQKTLRTKR